MRPGNFCGCNFSTGTSSKLANDARDRKGLTPCFHGPTFKYKDRTNGANVSSSDRSKNQRQKLVEDQMLGRAVRVCLQPAIFVSAVLAGGVFFPPTAHAQDDSPSSISALPTSTGPDESTSSSDYVRKPTDPPPFNPKSVQAVTARKRA